MNYVAEVAAYILSHCRRRELLGPELYAAIAEWEKEGVPSELVRASIDEAFLETDGHALITLIDCAVVRNFKNSLTQSR